MPNEQMPTQHDLGVGVMSDEIDVGCTEGGVDFAGGAIADQTPRALLALVRRAGSVAALADELGVNRRTLHRWIAGDALPGPFTRAYVDNLADNAGTARPFGGK